MRLIIIIMIIVLVIFGCSKQDSNKTIEGEKMQLTSDAIKYGEPIPIKYTCQGDDINPELKWFNAPAGTKSFALIADDPDAPVGLWTHWLVKDIPADVNEIAEDSVIGVQVNNSGGSERYHGPCPPYGTHRYFFKLFALDVPTFEARNKTEFYKKVQEHMIEQAVLMGTYKKR